MTTLQIDPATGMTAEALIARDVVDTQIRSAPPPQTLPQTPTAQIITNQISAAIGQTAVNDIEIRLDPEELGKLRIMLTPKEGGYDVMIIADRDQTLELMKRNAAALSDQFEEMAYEGSTLNFASSGNSEQPQEDEENQQFFAVLPPPTFGPRLTIPTDGLDIRY